MTLLDTTPHPAVAAYLDRIAANPVDRDLEAILRGMSAAADVLDEAALNPDTLELLRRDPVRGLTALADVLRRPRVLA